MSVKGVLRALRGFKPTPSTKLQPMVHPTSGRAGKVTLATVVGVSVALALGQFIPREESGRTVEATICAENELIVRHVSGRQYLNVYLDAVGVATACDGITTYQGRPLARNHTFTEAQCATMLEEELVKHAIPAMRCTPGIALSSDPWIEQRREGPRFLAVSLAYNVGVGNYCGSTAARRFNAGDYNGGCEAATWWNKAGNRVLRGLVSRRGKEALVCTEGLAALGRVL